MHKPDLHDYMKLGLVLFMAYPETITGYGPIEETVTKIALDNYFEAAEITWIKDAAVRASVRHIAQTSRLQLCYAAMPAQKTTGLNINDLDEAKRQQAVGLLKDGIDEAFELGAAGFSFMSGKYNLAHIEAHYQSLVKSTRELCAYAQAKGKMKMSLEIFDYDVDTCSLIGPTALARRYAAEICGQFANFGLMVDLSHLPQLRETPQQALPPIRDYINHAHIGNALVGDTKNSLYGDKHPRFGYPGCANDVEELTAYLAVLLNIGYLNTQTRPNLSIEVRPVAGETPELIIAHAKRTLELAWRNVFYRR